MNCKIELEIAAICAAGFSRMKNADEDLAALLPCEEDWLTEGEKAALYVLKKQLPKIGQEILEAKARIAIKRKNFAKTI